MILYVPLFRACTTVRTILQVHAHLIVTGHHKDPSLTTKLVDTYAKTGDIESARLVFNAFPEPDSFMWDVLIKSYVWNSFFDEAVFLYHGMQCPSNFTYPSVLRACSGLHDLLMGRKIHGRIVKSGFESDGVVETSLLQMYGQKGSFDDARQLFDRMPQRDTVSWSSMISSYTQNGLSDKGLEIFAQMISSNVEPDSVTMLSVTQACADVGTLKLGKSIHGYIVRSEIRTDGPLENSLVSMYSNFGSLDSAYNLFRRLSRRTTVSWKSMISCYNQNYHFLEALDLCAEMQSSGVSPNSVTMVGVLTSCAQLGYMKEGKSVHGFVIRRRLDLDLIGNTLIDMYGGFGKVGDCAKVFETIKEKTVVSWNSLIAVNAHNGFSETALDVFLQMLIEGFFPDSFTFASSLSACAQMSCLPRGSHIHGCIIKIGLHANRFVQNALIDMYSKCGFVDIAYRIFDEMPEKDQITWNSIITGLSQNGNSIDAIVLFDKMLSKCLKPEPAAFVGAIQACSHLGSLEKGKLVHNKVVVHGFVKDIYVDTALVDMYSKCGDITTARRIFDDMIEKNVVSWSAMIAGFGLHGYIDVAVSLFSQMTESGIKPNQVTFMSILSACSHAGYVEKGWFYFNLMRQEFSIEPELDHFVCMVDLLSRAGQLEWAYDFIKSMPIEPNVSIWGALLSGCRVHHRIDLIDSIQKSILDLEQKNSEYYVLLSNVYADERNWEEFGKVRSRLKNMRKVPGYSMIEMNRTIHRFSAGDFSHPQIKEIHSFLVGIVSSMQEQGYILDEENLIKEKIVESHSEKLAIAFGILNTSPGLIIRVSKNLRVCGDCHTFTKFVTEITGREIIMRDLNRFHHFKNGSCSCKDFW